MALLALAILFLCLATDEAASIHEMAAPAVYQWLAIVGQVGSVLSVFGTSWLLAGGPFTIIAFLVYWRFFLHLPLATRVLFLVAGSLYIAGAIGSKQ